MQNKFLNLYFKTNLAQRAKMWNWLCNSSPCWDFTGIQNIKILGSVIKALPLFKGSHTRIMVHANIPSSTHCATCRVPQGVSACTVIPACDAWHKSNTLMFHQSETPKSDILNPLKSQPGLQLQNQLPCCVPLDQEIHCQVQVEQSESRPNLPEM